MTEDKGRILIYNIYYMLTYAFQELRKNNYDDIDKEEFERIQDLFAEILWRGVSYQLKQGLYREYINRKDTLPVLKGKLDIPETIRNRVQHKNVLACEFDELSENNIFNRIIKTTANILIHEKSVSSAQKKRLKSILPFFDGVDAIDPSLIKWNMLRYQRNNQTYRMLMNICYFIIDGMLMTTQKGKYHMETFSDEHMNKLFEKFVLNFYRRNHSELSANPDQISWDIDKEQQSIIDFLPGMQTDITLHKDGKTLIIDTKYYGSTTQTQFNKKTIHSANMYQIFTYVKNLDKDNTGYVSGMLLYAKTNEDISPDLDAYFGKNRIRVKTLDLYCKFAEIERQLNELAQF